MQINKKNNNKKNIKKNHKLKPKTIQCNQCNQFKSKFRIRVLKSKSTFVNFHKIRRIKIPFTHEVNSNRIMYVSYYISVYIIIYIEILCSTHSTTLTDVAAVSLNCALHQQKQPKHYFHVLTTFKINLSVCVGVCCVCVCWSSV